jgi:hypothetical protein
LTAPTPARAAAATTTPVIVHLDRVRLPQTRIVVAAAPTLTSGIALFWQIEGSSTAGRCPS